MPPFTQPSFQERTALATKAKQAALEKLRAKPPISEEALAERTAARIAREQAEATARAEKLAAREQLKAQRKAEKEQDIVPPPPALTEAEKKEARDARYAARKIRRKK